jgi:hypothetical protein
MRGGQNASVLSLRRVTFVTFFNRWQSLVAIEVLWPSVSALPSSIATITQQQLCVYLIAFMFVLV